jgi:hypothetical protein
MSLAVTEDVMIAAVTRSIGVFKTTVAVLRAVENGLTDSGISRDAKTCCSKLLFSRSFKWPGFLLD